MNIKDLSVKIARGWSLPQEFVDNVIKTHGDEGLWKVLEVLHDHQEKQRKLKLLALQNRKPLKFVGR